jgi:hypothetical protein
MKLNTAEIKLVQIKFLTYEEVLESYKQDKDLKQLNEIGDDKIIGKDFEIFDVTSRVNGRIFDEEELTKHDVLIIDNEDNLGVLSKEKFNKMYVKE